MTPLLSVRGLTKDFSTRQHFFGRQTTVRAIDGVTFDIRPGETFGLVGESGSGKTTTARCILRLVEPTAGEVRFDGEDVRALSPARLRAARRKMQIVFQDPYTSLNPRMRAQQIVEEPLIVHRCGDRASRLARVIELLELVGLDPALRARYPHEFSGGQRQRLGIARALALNPGFVVADEPVAALDVSVQAQIVNLLLDLQERLRLTYLLIAHDLRLVRHVCTRLAVMYAGKIVEIGGTEDVFERAAHPYTRALISAIPVLDVHDTRVRIAFDASRMDRATPLREVAPGHMAAV